MHIGELAEHTGLSLRTIRHYDEIGLLVPSGRTAGGFRLYSATDIVRLLLLKRMKPLGYSLDEMRRLLALVNALDVGTEDPEDRGELLRQLTASRDEVEQRLVKLREMVGYAEEFLSRLDTEVSWRAFVGPVRS